MTQFGHQIIISMALALLALSGCATDVPETQEPIPALTPTAVPTLTPTSPRHEAHRVIDFYSEDSFPRLSWSPDSRYLAVGANDEHEITIWEVETLPAPRLLEYPEIEWAFDGAFSPDGRLLSFIECPERIYPTAPCSVVIWNWQAGKLVDKLWLASVNADLAWSPDSMVLAIWAGEEEQIRFWVDPTNSSEAPEPIPVSGVVSADLVWLPDGTLRMAVFGEGRIGIWNSHDPSVINNLLADPDGYYSSKIWLSADGLRTVSENGQGDVAIWDAIDGTLLQTIPFPHLWVSNTTISGDGLQVAVYDDEAITVWDVATGGMIARLTIDSASLLMDFAFSPDGQTLAASYRNGEIHLWDLQAAQAPPATVTPIPTRTPHPSIDISVQKLSFTAPMPPPRGEGWSHQLYGASWIDNQALRIRRFEFNNDSEVATSSPLQLIDIDIASQSIIGVQEVDEDKFYNRSPDGSLYVKTIRGEGDEPTRAVVVNVQTDQVLFHVPYDPYSNEHFIWSQDQRRIYIEKDEAIEVYNGQDGTPLGMLSNPESDVLYSSFVLSPDGKWAASTNVNPGAAVIIWNLDTMQIAHEVPFPDDPEHRLGHLDTAIWAPDSSRVILSFWKGAEVFNLATGQIERLMIPESNNDPISFESHYPFWSPDGAWLIHRGYISVKDGPLIMFGWNVLTGESRIIMKYAPDAGEVGHRGHEAWHLERQWFATADLSGNVYVVSVESGEMLLLDSAFGYEPIWLEWSPDGHSLAGLDENGLIQIWTFD